MDDEPDITFTIKSIMKENGIQIDPFNDPVIALKSYKRYFYDLVVLDIKMPKMDGFELYTKIRELDPNVKICFLTAIATLNEGFIKLRSEFDRLISEGYFIQKPIKTEDLIKKIATIINKDTITMQI
ncbi:MAG TPA: response regulator [Nitrososphaeraceae archaeon]|nr:response regulator [Nitrososphaeraceae archaeon]